MPKKKKNKNIPVKPVFKIFCEGEKTEPLYINGYIDYFHSEKRNIFLVPHTRKNTPVQLVDVAVNAKNKNKEDTVWVVFDRESESKYSHDLHAQARKKAKDNDIEIALSNVCFEYWILLHFAYSTAPYNSYDDLLKRSKLRTYLQDLGIKDYDKGLPILFDKLKTLIPDAMSNAQKLKTQAKASAERGKSAPHFLNPYVDTHEMFQDMQKFIDNEPSVRSKAKS